MILDHLFTRTLFESQTDHITQFASNAHEEWRRNFDPTGTKPRIKKNSDGTEGDINVPFADLHPDWQKENLAAAHAAHRAVKHFGRDMEKAAEYVHNEWMKRNPKADYNAAQHVPYDDLPEDEKEKDRVHVRTMMQLMGHSPEQGVAEGSHEDQVSRLAAYNEIIAGENPPIELGLREVGNWAKVGHYGNPIKTAWLNIAKYGVRNNRFEDSVDQVMSAIGEFPDLEDEVYDMYDINQDEVDILYNAYETVYDQWEQSQGLAEGRVAQLPTHGADYSKYDTGHLKTMLRPGILHRDEARFKSLIRQELKKREQQSQQGVAEGSELKQAKRKYNQAAKDANLDQVGAGKKIDTMKNSLRQKDVDNKKQDVEEGILGSDPNRGQKVPGWAKGGIIGKIGRKLDPAWSDIQMTVPQHLLSKQSSVPDKKSLATKDIPKAKATSITPTRAIPKRAGTNSSHPVTKNVVKTIADKSGVAESNTLMKKLHQALLKEGRVKELADDLKTLNDAEFMKKYGKAKAAIRRDMKKVDEGQLNELSTNKLAQYKTAAAADAKKADQAGDVKRGDKRFSGIVNATKKQFDNDAKKIEESRQARQALMAQIVNSR